MVELDFLLKTVRQDKKETNVFLASLQGIDLEQYYDNPIEEKRREIERRAAEKRLGALELEKQELAEFGLNFESV